MFSLPSRSLDVRTTLGTAMMALPRLGAHGIELHDWCCACGRSASFYGGCGRRSRHGICGAICSRVVFAHHDLCLDRCWGGPCGARPCGPIASWRRRIRWLDDSIGPGVGARSVVVITRAWTSTGSLLSMGGGGGPVHPPEALVLGAMSRMKRPDLALEAFAFARERRPDLQPAVGWGAGRGGRRAARCAAARASIDGGSGGPRGLRRRGQGSPTGDCAVKLPVALRGPRAVRPGRRRGTRVRPPGGRSGGRGHR